jgi:CBS-domain-containing membrane protein
VQIKTNSVHLVRERTEKLMPTFADRGCHVVSVTDPYGRILGFLDSVQIKFK